jgi:hypothetical protein
MTRIIIRAVKDRANYIDYLKEKLPNAEWCFDEKRNAMHTFIKALRMANNEPTIHMEEDVVLTDNFISKIEAEILKNPNKVIQFFSMRKADLTVGSRWDDNFLMAQCFYLPAGYANEIISYYSHWSSLESKQRYPTGLDLMVGDFLRKRKERYWIHVPSLVDHRVGVSAINAKRPKHRTSKTFKAE